MRPIQTARRLRRGMTKAEWRLWSRLRDRQVGAKFRRQMPIGRFIADFACVEARLVIEVDGGQHAIRLDADRERTAVIETAGYLVMRFWNEDVLTRLEDVVEEVSATLAARRSPDP